MHVKSPDIIVCDINIKIKITALKQGFLPFVDHQLWANKNMIIIGLLVSRFVEIFKCYICNTWWWTPKKGVFITWGEEFETITVTFQVLTQSLTTE